MTATITMAIVSALIPTYRRAIDNQTTLDLSVELMDHERFIDRGIPTGANGAPVDGLRDIVFGSASLDNITTWRQPFSVER